MDAGWAPSNLFHDKNNPWRPILAFGSKFYMDPKPSQETLVFARFLTENTVTRLKNGRMFEARKGTSRHLLKRLVGAKGILTP